MGPSLAFSIKLPTAWPCEWPSSSSRWRRDQKPTMPNTRPVNDNASVTRAVLERTAAVASTRVWPIGAVSLGSRGEALAEIGAMQKAGIVAVSDDGRPIATAKLLRQVMDYCHAL